MGKVCILGFINTTPYSSLASLTDYGTQHSIGVPIQVYPLYENAFRAHRNQSLEENDKESAQLYANFAKVAEQNPLAWNFGKPAEAEDTIRTVTKKNRMICYPCELPRERLGAHD